MQEKGISDDAELTNDELVFTRMYSL